MNSILQADMSCMEYNGIHEQLQGMVQRGQFSDVQLNELVRLKKMVDRFAFKPYTSATDARHLQERYGASPGLLSWGDYFQTEIGSACFGLSDKDFCRVADTIYFDLIAAIKIFQNKSEIFFARANEEGLAVYGKERNTWTRKEEKQAHLYILLQYFNEIGLAETELSPDDENWFQTFVAVNSRKAG